MCTPLAAASLAATAAGTGLSIAGQRQARSAVEDAVAAEQVRQSLLDDRAKEAIAKITGDLSAESQKTRLQDAETQRVNRVGTALAKGEAPVAIQNLKSNAPEVISTEVDNAQASAKRFAAALAARGARLKALEDLSLGNRLMTSDAASNINNIANFKAGSQSVLPIELVDARHKGSTLKGLGDLLNAAGMVAGFGALAKAPTAAMKAAEAARAQALIAKNGATSAAIAKAGATTPHIVGGTTIPRFLP